MVSLSPLALEEYRDLDAASKAAVHAAAAGAYEAAANQKGGDAAEALFRLGRVRLDNLRAYEKAAENFGLKYIIFDRSERSENQWKNFYFNSKLKPLFAKNIKDIEKCLFEK